MTQDSLLHYLCALSFLELSLRCQEHQAFLALLNSLLCQGTLIMLRSGGCPLEGTSSPVDVWKRNKTVVFVSVTTGIREGWGCC